MTQIYDPNDHAGHRASFNAFSRGMNAGRKWIDVATPQERLRLSKAFGVSTIHEFVGTVSGEAKPGFAKVFARIVSGDDDVAAGRFLDERGLKAAEMDDEDFAGGFLLEFEVDLMKKGDGVRPLIVENQS